MNLHCSHEFMDGWKLTRKEKGGWDPDVLEFVENLGHWKASRGNCNQHSTPDLRGLGTGAPSLYMARN